MKRVVWRVVQIDVKEGNTKHIDRVVEENKNFIIQTTKVEVDE